MPSTAFQLTKWSLHLATRLIKADTRVHNVDAIKDDMSIIFVVNHFTRLETLLLPYALNKETGANIWSLAAGELFVGRIGRYLNATGAISTAAPDRDKTIVHSLLSGEKSWIIFPEGSMIKDKKVIDARGMFSVYSHGDRRPPHTGAAVLALRAEFYRHRLACMKDSASEEERAELLKYFELDSVDQALGKRTVIIPVNITYFPMRAQENIVLRMARQFAKDLSPRALEELTVEGTVLSADTDIDITLGEPIEVRQYLDTPEFAQLLECSDADMSAMEDDPKSQFAEAARRLMYRYMSDIYRLTTINYDHIFATILRHMRARRFTMSSFRNRAFLAAHRIKELGHHRLHELLAKTHRDLVFDEPSPKLDNFFALCMREGIITQDGDSYVRNLPDSDEPTEFHSIRQNELTQVIANEIEPLSILTNLLKDVARAPKAEIGQQIRDLFLGEDLRIFDNDYKEHYLEDETHPREIGQPFLLLPEGPFRTGIVLTHGYLSAPEEVRAMGEYLRARGYAVYGTRLRGHGTSPEDLAQTPWEEWYASLNRGYAIMKSYTDEIILGGFSTGGVLSLLGAGRKGAHIRTVFSINAPLALQSYGARFAPTIVSMNALIRRVRKSHDVWDFIPNNPENKHINYSRNPLTGVAELSEAMDTMKEALPDIRIPAYILQASRDHVVKPSSGQMIFDRVGTPNKEFCMLERPRHGIINGRGADDVFEHVYRFLLWAKDKPAEALITEEEPEAEETSSTDEAAAAGETEAAVTNI